MHDSWAISWTQSCCPVQLYIPQNQENLEQKSAFLMVKSLSNVFIIPLFPLMQIIHKVAQNIKIKKCPLDSNGK